jgi:hypothetical protein
VPSKIRITVNQGVTNQGGSVPTGYGIYFLITSQKPLLIITSEQTDRTLVRNVILSNRIMGIERSCFP